MTAKEMFEKLGYKRTDSLLITSDDLSKCFIDYEKDKTHITISSLNGTKSVCKYSLKLFGIKCVDITIQELQAINKQLEELGWLDD
ncbi:hypothetical protein [uncultured Thomasclavelia sp.]|uniref:hypothetical protein n=1 Tax=uncultured Thomasclavelia sp. TaxID=3025759 RepID=UPI002595FDB7|nr:hypothetical protein [uncultured Thomasclavelia sp.]